MLQRMAWRVRPSGRLLQDLLYALHGALPDTRNAEEFFPIPQGGFILIANLLKSIRGALRAPVCARVPP